MIEASTKCNSRSEAGQRVHGLKGAGPTPVCCSGGGWPVASTRCTRVSHWKAGAAG
jgi:hypothetical protein